jgi:hypothetical protein
MIEIRGKLSTSDILTVVTSRAERHFNENLRIAREIENAIDKEVVDKTTEINNMHFDECMAAVADKFPAVQAAIAAIGGEARVDPGNFGCCSLIVRNKGEYQLRPSPKLIVYILVDSAERSRGQAAYLVTANYSAAFIALCEELVVLLNKQAAALVEIANWKKKIAAIPALERQYRAKIAEETLLASADGRALLAILSDNLEKDMLALPINESAPPIY